MWKMIQLNNWLARNVFMSDTFLIKLFKINNKYVWTQISKTFFNQNVEKNEQEVNEQTIHMCSVTTEMIYEEFKHTYTEMFPVLQWQQNETDCI